MSCVPHCQCSKCVFCGLCTNGSQYHRTCAKQESIELMAEDNEVFELMANAGESLPSEEEEAAAIEVQRNTPISFQEEHLSSDEDDTLFEENYQFKRIVTDVDQAFAALRENFPDEDFDSFDYQRISIPAYLTSEMNKLEFFIANNQWGHRFVHYPENTLVRMRKGVIARYNAQRKEHDYYHLHCIDSSSANFSSLGFTKALLTVESRNYRELLKLIISSPDPFFCKACHYYMFDAVEYYKNSTWQIPSTDVWPVCSALVYSKTLNNTNEKTYVTVYVNKLIVVVHPQVQPIEEQSEDSSSDSEDSDLDTLPDINE